MRKKYQLPNWYKLNKQFDIDLLKEETLRVYDKFKNVIQSNNELCSNNHDLVEKVYEHFEQINLTTFNDEIKNLSLEECKILGESAGSDEKLSRVEKYKLKISQRMDRPELDERNYNKPTEFFKGTYFEEVANSFKSEAIRVRLVKLKPYKVIPPHIDYDPTYATRIIIPIISDEYCINTVWRHKIPESFVMENDGHAYFLNTGLQHSVVNMGNTDRITLMMSLKNQDDLGEIQ